MKRIVISILLGLCALTTSLMAPNADAAVIINTCTSTYYAINYPGIEVPSGWDTVAISTDTSPLISVVKYAKNLRTGIESSNMVYGLPGDTIEYKIVWQNQGGSADTVTLTDYIPSLMNYIGSLSDTEANCDTPGTAVFVSGETKVFYVVNGAHSVTPGPSGDGVIRFRAVIK